MNSKTVDTQNVVHGELKLNIPRNFSFAALGNGAQRTNGSTVRVTPALFTLFIEDFKVKRGVYDDLYDAAWKSYGILGQLELSYIIC